jgi:hypothetical protein
MFVSLSYTERESTVWFRARERKRVVLLKEYVRTLCLIERELCVRKFRLIATIVLSLFFFFSLDSYALYVYARLKKRRK